MDLAPSANFPFYATEYSQCPDKKEELIIHMSKIYITILCTNTV